MQVCKSHQNETLLKLNYRRHILILASKCEIVAPLATFLLLVHVSKKVFSVDSLLSVDGTGDPITVRISFIQDHG